MINTIIEIIHSLNGGSVIPFQLDAETMVDLGTDMVKLYVDSLGKEKKYYYFARYEVDDNKDDNLGQIEREILGARCIKTATDPARVTLI